jgi:hypothetical protein
MQPLKPPPALLQRTMGTSQRTEVCTQSNTAYYRVESPEGGKIVSSSETSELAMNFYKGGVGGFDPSRNRENLLEGSIAVIVQYRSSELLD